MTDMKKIFPTRILSTTCDHAMCPGTREATTNEMIKALRNRQFLVVEVPWPDWLRENRVGISIGQLEWLWAHQHIEGRVE